MKNLFERFVLRRESSWLSLVDWVSVVIAIVIFTYLTLPNLVAASAYFDEGYSAYLASVDLFMMAKYTALDVHPPLYYALLHFWQILVGNGVAELRLMSLFFGWMAILFGFLIVRRGFGHQAAWLGTILMALSPLFIRYGASMRMYTLALAIGLAATYFLMVALARKKRWPWVVYAILVAAGMWTNYFTALIWLAHLTWLIFVYRKDKGVMKSWSLAIIGSIVLYLPWLPALVYRAGEIQASGFWIKPVSLDTIVSTITMNFVFRSAADTTGWLLVIIIALVISLVIACRGVFGRLSKDRQPTFLLLGSMAFLPVLYLIIISLPPFRPAYVYRYVLFASVCTTLLIAVTVSYAKFNRHDVIKRFLLYSATIFIFVAGSYHAVVVGNRNLDTDAQNKLAQIMKDVHESKHEAPVIIRSPYSYYAASLYTEKNYPAYFLYNPNLAGIGSTKPLYDHVEKSVRNSSLFDKVWLVGEDRGAVSPPPLYNWKLVDYKIEYDDITNKPVAFAYYYERIY